MKTLYTSIIALFIGLSASAQIDRSQQPKPGPDPVIQLGEPEKFTLKNGLTVLIVENNKLPRVSASLNIDNPPIVEGQKAGVSQLTGALMGKGSLNQDKDSFNEEVDFMGASIGFGSQSASASSLSRYFGRVLEMMADAALNPNFTEEEFVKERDILLDGIKSEEKSVTTAARRVESLLAYGVNHPYGEFISKESVEQVSLEDVKQFYQAYFHPNNAYLVIVGDINVKALKKQIKNLFKEWKLGADIISNTPMVENAANTQIEFVDMPNAVQTEVTVQNTVSLQKKDPDYFPLLLANAILGGGGEARLFLNLREDKGYTYGSYSRMGNNKYTETRFRATASVRNTVADSSVVEILKEVDRIRTEQVSEEELRRAKAKYIGSFVRAVERPGTIASYAYEIETEDLPKDFYANYLSNISSVTQADIQRVAQKYFLVDQARVVVTGKATEVLENLEKIQFNGQKLSVNYYDKYGNLIDRPSAFELPEGVTANTILQNYIDAIGGQSLIESINTLSVAYQGNIMGNVIEAKTISTSEDQTQLISMGGNVMATVYVGQEDAYIEQMGNKMDMPSEMAADVRSSLGIVSELSLLNDENLEVTGLDEISGEKAYAVTNKGGSSTSTSYFSVESGLKLKQVSVVEAMGQTQTQEQIFGEYKSFGGLQLPTVSSIPLGPQTIEVTLSGVEINGDVVEGE
jgi:predicted Zn-dependent peptidase